MNNFGYKLESEFSEGEQSYVFILDQVQSYMSANFATLMQDTDSAENERLLKRNVEQYVTDKKLKCKGIEKMSALVDKLFNSMCRYDFLTPYILDDNFILENEIEEINANGWNSIFVTDKTGTHLIDECFPSSKHATNTLNSLATRLDKSLNTGTPIFLGEVRKNIRIACVGLPIVDEDCGIHFSIRIVSLSDLSREQLLDYGTFIEGEINLLETCLSHGINILIGGATNSGKTGTMGYLLSHVAQNPKKRIGTIEIEAREFNLAKFDENGMAVNNVFSWRTRESPDARQNINSDKLEELILRFSPMIIGVGEMRNKEAMITCEIATTGHTVISTTHTESATDAYDRVVMLCKKANMGYDDATLYRLAIKAFPIVAFQKQYKDKSRKCEEIVEGIGYENGKVITRTLYKYIVDSSSEALVVGKHKFFEGISAGLVNKLKSNGVNETEIHQLVTWE